MKYHIQQTTKTKLESTCIIISYTYNFPKECHKTIAKEKHLNSFQEPHLCKTISSVIRKNLTFCTVIHDVSSFFKFHTLHNDIILSNMVLHFLHILFESQTSFFVSFLSQKGCGHFKLEKNLYLSCYELPCIFFLPNENEIV